MNKAVAPRAHIEWILSDGYLWAVQIDLEWKEKETGVDPKTALRSRQQDPPDITAACVFKRYVLHSPTHCRKLDNLNDFDFSESAPPPNLFYATASCIKDCVTAGKADSLADEINKLTACRCVIRTDLLKSGKAFNLPRTDTLDGAEAVTWLVSQLAVFDKNEVKLENVVFILHAFLPALAAAWVYADPHNQIVWVDSLWGLPDGLQFLPHDSFQVDVVRATILSEKIRYKPRFLMEEDDGKWRYVDVLTSKARQRSLPKASVIEIALRTLHMAQKLNSTAQVMWFCGVPESHSKSSNIPWFRARDLADPAPRQDLRHKPVDVRGFEDLLKLADGPHTLRLLPDALLVRDESFVDAVIAKAIETRSAVALQGSLLGHTYYKLSSAGLPIILHDPVQHYRKRGKRGFGKLVRDKISAGIASRGEIVREAILKSDDIISGLAAKLCEESVELFQAKGREQLVEELSDIYELAAAILLHGHIEEHALKSAIDLKREKRGGFAERRVLLETSLPMPGTTAETLLEVGLREIAHATLNGESAYIPFAALFANSEGLTIDIGGLLQSDTVTLRLVAGGLRIESRASNGHAQLDLQMEMFDVMPIPSVKKSDRK